MEQTTKTEDERRKIDRRQPSKVPVGECQLEEKQTRIVVEKEGDSVSAIRIACRCGEETVVNCVYPETDQ